MVLHQNIYLLVLLSAIHRSRYTTGRFCSNNLQGSSLFKMYSHDGHALIKFHSDGSDSGAGFALQYKMIQTSNGLPGYEGCSS